MNNQATVIETIKKSLENSIPYLQYRVLVESHVINNSNTGAEVTEDLAGYTALSHQRMKRLDKTTKLPADVKEFLSNFNKDIMFLTITESWCGDAAQTIPVIEKIAKAGDIQHRLVLRDENEELMNHFLTNGNKSIAKLIVLDKETKKPLATWGPRPSLATALVTKEKEKKGELSPEFKQELQSWYNKDKGQNTVEDLTAILKSL